MSRCTRAFVIGCWLFLPATSPAQSIDRNRSETPRTDERQREPLLEQAIRLSRPLAVRRPEQRPENDPSGSRQRTRSPRQRIFGAIVGATGGFFAGGYTGAWIEGDRCHCDDPGLKGALIGAPVGAAVGGVLGGLYLF